MVRPSQLLHPQREPAPVRPAATVLLLRDTPQGIEILMTRRSMNASFAPGAYVFPGGGIDGLDAASHAQASRRATQSDLHLTQAIAAIRESFEELGILLARRPDGTFKGLIDTSPKFARNVLSALARDFTVWMNRMTVFTKFPVKRRLILALLILHEQYRISGSPPGVITITRTELSEYVGASLETVVRVLNTLKVKDLVQINGRRILIKDIEEMVMMMEGEEV